MNDNPYIRPALTATGKGIADGALLVECWLDRLVDLHEGRGTGETSVDAYDLLATWARLKRTRPDLFTKLDRQDEWKQLDSAIQARREQVARAVLQADPTGWLQEAEEFYAAIESPMSDADLSLWAERLLTDLDDADLVAWAVEPLGLFPDIKISLRECYQWLADHVSAFTLCSVFAQAIGMALDPELPGVDLDLAWTAHKFVGVLDASEEAEADLAFSGCAVLAPLQPIVRDAPGDRPEREPDETPVPQPVKGTKNAAILPGPGPSEKRRREEREPNFTMAAQSMSATKPSPPKASEGATVVSAFKLSDQQGRVVELRTDRDGRVFAVLPEAVLRIAPKRVLIDYEAYLLKPSAAPIFEIVDLGVGDLRALADSDLIVKGTWE